MNVRHCRQLELAKDYDLQIQCHRGKANVIPNALSREIHNSVNVMTMVRLKILRDLKNMGIEPLLVQNWGLFLVV